nr:sugar ABC transporter substrate-binding protein [Propionicimonas sp.]
MARLKLISAAIAVTIALAAAGCTPSSTPTGTDSSAPAGKTAKIAMSITNMDQWLQLLADAVSAEAKEKGVTVEVVSADADVAKQIGQVENFISQKVDAIIVNPVDNDASQPITDAAVAAGVPLVYVNRCPDRPDNVPCVGSDSKQAGSLLMEALGKLTDNKGDVGILQGDPNNNGQAVRERSQGCQDVVDKNPGMKVTLTANGKWARDAAQSVTENWIQSGKLPAMICANNDEMALGAINALKAAKLLDKVKVGGIDATSDALASMAAGELSVTVFQDPAGQGAGAVDAAIKLINKESVDTYVDVPFQLVTKDNMDQFK